MTKWFLLLTVAGLAAAGWFNRDKILAWMASPVSLPQLAAPVTPHPAAESVARAKKTYPALEVEGSLFNKKFVQIYNEVKDQDPAFLGQADWPMQLAERTARELNGAIPARPSPTPAAIAQIHGTLLDAKRGAAAAPTATPGVQLPGFQGSMLDQRPAPMAKRTPVPH